MDNFKVIKNLVFEVIKEKNLTKFKDILSQLDEPYIYKLKYGTENMLEISYRLNAHDIFDYLLSITDVDVFIVKSYIIMARENKYSRRNRYHRIIRNEWSNRNVTLPFLFLKQVSKSKR